MPAVWTVVGKRYTLQGHASCVSDRFHHKTKAKVEKQAIITSFPARHSGFPGRDGRRQIQRIATKNASKYSGAHNVKS